ncbi:MAG: hypothetical protein COS85_16225 [Armatimonadetes bacterium CG07_land_8_20_14_0_80_59_28]|nr:MAG: hypothetical protein COS85_16225 [Armatimonadetes bacterium CG07_land_8_20_14_0_80_59_28]PJB64388.1 MAG: hypothetical protein CO095_14970 [Armatimonadetes bacterium CG_4_9_14_3_um_filter_58_7]
MSGTRNATQAKPGARIISSSPDRLKEVRGIMQQAGVNPVTVTVKPPAARRAKAGAGPHLTDTEINILQTIADCGTIGATAEKLGMNRRTVESHLAHIRLKADVSTTVEAVVWGWRKGLVE